MQAHRDRAAASGYTETAETEASELAWYVMLVSACEVTANEPELRAAVSQLLLGGWMSVDPEELVATALAVLG